MHWYQTINLGWMVLWALVKAFFPLQVLTSGQNRPPGEKPHTGEA